MTPWLAVIDFEVLVWGILAVVYVLAQILGQFTKKEGEAPKKSPWRQMPEEIREFLDEIKEQAGLEEEQEEAPPPPARRPPPPIRSQPVSASPVQPATPAYRGSAKRIDAALEQRRHQFQCQIQRQAEKLNRRHRFTPGHATSLVGEKPAELPENTNMAYLSAGLKGFQLPSLGLPSASASLQERTIQHPVELQSADRLREALILSVILGPPVSETPPGYKNIMTQN